jgi:hypothetical protein
MTDIFIDPADKDPETPDIGLADACDRQDCPGPEGWQMSFGLAGGGIGCYQYCGRCERVVAKTCDDE